MHLQQDITAAHEFAVNKDLWDGGPIAEVLDSWKRTVLVELKFVLNLNSAVLPCRKLSSSRMS